MIQQGLLLLNTFCKVAFFGFFGFLQFSFEVRKGHEPGEYVEQAFLFRRGDLRHDHGRHALKAFYFREVFKKIEGAFGIVFLDQGRHHGGKGGPDFSGRASGIHHCYR